MGVHVFPKFQSIIVQIIQFTVLCLYLVEFIIFFTTSLFHKYYIMFIIISHQSTIVYKKENVGKNYITNIYDTKFILFHIKMWSKRCLIIVFPFFFFFFFLRERGRERSRTLYSIKFMVCIKIMKKMYSLWFNYTFEKQSCLLFIYSRPLFNVQWFFSYSVFFLIIYHRLMLVEIIFYNFLF